LLSRNGHAFASFAGLGKSIAASLPDVGNTVLDGELVSVDESPSDLPAWLTREVYVRQILPALANVTKSPNTVSTRGKRTLLLRHPGGQVHSAPEALADAGKAGGAFTVTRVRAQDEAQALVSSEPRNCPPLL
jgi:hypothetical protein